MKTKALIKITKHLMNKGYIQKQSLMTEPQMKKELNLFKISNIEFLTNGNIKQELKGLPKRGEVSSHTAKFVNLEGDRDLEKELDRAIEEHREAQRKVGEKKNAISDIIIREKKI